MKDVIKKQRLVFYADGQTAVGTDAVQQLTAVSSKYPADRQLTPEVRQQQQVAAVATALPRLMGDALTAPQAPQPMGGDSAVMVAKAGTLPGKGESMGVEPHPVHPASQPTGDEPGEGGAGGGSGISSGGYHVVDGGDNHGGGTPGGDNPGSGTPSGDTHGVDTPGGTRTENREWELFGLTMLKEWWIAIGVAVALLLYVALRRRED